MPDSEAPGPAPAAGLTEGVSRWLAGRTTRRSFLGRLGRAAVLVASGSAMATLLVGDEAEARVCGQSGVADRCPTYDCDGVWGWCWYATGCCAGGALKKICDCCAPINNVHGYCPSGTNVRCIVESCGADPRVQVVTINRIPTDEPVAAAAGASRFRVRPGGGAEVWLVEAGQALLASVLAPAAARRSTVLLLAGGPTLGAPLVAELQRLGARRATLWGAGLSEALVADLARYAIATERRAVEPTVSAVQAVADGVAAEFRGAGIRRAVCVEPYGFSLAAAPLAGALAAAAGYPLVVGVDRALEAAMVLTYLVGPEAADRAGEVPGGHPLFSASWPALSAEVADVALRIEGVASDGIALVAYDTLGLAALLPAGGPILVHPPGSLDGVRSPLVALRDRLRSVALAGAAGALATEGYYELQSIVNGFDADRLIGVAGQGLPVIDQPLAERPPGLARRAAAPPVELTPPYWTGRGADLGGR